MKSQTSQSTAAKPDPDTKPISPQDKEPVKEKAVGASVPSVLKTIDASKGILVIILAAVTYFFGWRFLFAYYAGFGLDSALFTISPTDVIFAGWRIYILVAVLLISATMIWVVCQSLSQHLVQKRRLKFVVSAFYVLLIIGIALGAYIICQLLRFFFFNIQATYTFYILAFIDIAFLWIAFAFGEYIHRTAQSIMVQNSPFTPFNILFPSPLVWLAIIGLATIMTLALVSSGSGALYSVRDRRPGSRLQIVTFFVDEQLSIANGHRVRHGVWRYDNLRLVTKTEDNYFVFRLDEVINGTATLYAIPKEHVVEFQTRPWYDKSQRP